MTGKLIIKKHLLPLALAALSLMVLASCSSPFVGSLSLPSNQAVDLKYADLVARGYMGGSVLYAEGALGSGHLQPGAQVAIRLAKYRTGLQTVEAEDANGLITEAQVTSYDEIPSATLYGTLIVSQAALDQVAFSVSLLDTNGTEVRTGALSLRQGESADLDGDAVPDLRYVAGTTIRPDATDMAFLEFLSNQATLTTTMFSVVTESYGSRDFPSGVIGVNPAGKFIVNGQTTGGGSRSLESIVKSGDYVMDAAGGVYRRVLTDGTTTGARSLNDESVTEILPEESMLDILPIMHFDLAAPAAPIEESESRAATWTQFQSERAAILDSFRDLKQIAAWSPKVDAGILADLGMDPARLSVKLGADASGSIGWDGAKAMAKVAALIDTGEVVVRLNKTLTKELLTPLDEEITTSFAIGPVIVDLGGYLEAGMTLKAGVDTANLVDFRGGYTGMYGGRFSARVWADLGGVHFKKDFDTINKTTAFIGLDWANTNKSAAWVSLVPWAKVGATAKLFKVFYGRVGPYIDFENRADVAVVDASRLVGTATGSLGTALTAEAGFKIKLPFGLGTVKKSWDWSSGRKAIQVYQLELFNIPL